MLIKLENPFVLSKAIELISELVTEVKLKVNEFGISITAIDPANVAMVNFRIPKSAFSRFDVEKEELGINLDNLKRVLKRAGAGSSIILQKKDNSLTILIEDKIKRTFNISLIDLDVEDIDFNSKLANMEFSTKVAISSIDLVSAIEDCAVVSDACYFAKDNGNFIIESKGINSAKSEFSGDEVKLVGEDAKAKYSIEYLSKFIKGAKISENAIIEFAQDHPLRIDFRSPHIEISFVLAPRVETED